MDRRLIAFFLLLPVPGRAGARASTVIVALTRDRHRRIASAADRENPLTKEVSSVAAKKKSSGGKKKSAKKSSKKK